MLPRGARLRKKQEFEQVYQQGRRVSMEAFTMYGLKRDESSPPQVGFVVGRRFGSHVARNRVKRRLRAAVRTLWSQMPQGYALVLVAREAAATMPFETLRRQVQQALHTLQQGGTP